ncbi:30S ribosomal protein S16 [Patescibacteria group bacterium]|nr:30S ribosomal protein S16 [Patescibacteria group bacterium]MBU0963899.1 30S ribosomal protein S16 [Patescibacteria group bacterium]
MLTIRLSRFGKKKHPLYRVIISEKQKDTKGDYLELLGRYDPHTNKVELKAERIKYWLSKGAQTSGVVHNLLIDQKIIEGEKLQVANIKKKKEEPKKDDKPEEKPAEPKAEPKAEEKNSDSDKPKAENKIETPAKPADKPTESK